MSVMTYRRSALRNPDPYAACLHGAKEHPRYHDCENCEHIADKTCEYGIGQKTAKDLRTALAEGESMLAAYPRLNPARLP